METPGNEKAQTALAAMLEYADAAAANWPDDYLCCWQYEMIAGHERVTATRVSANLEDTSIIALPAIGGVAQHIAGWDPRTARLMQDLLTDIFAGADPATLKQKATEICAAFVSDHPLPECSPDDNCWHHTVPSS